MAGTRSTFALLIANRGFFPASLIGAARAELTRRLEELGHSVLLLDENATRHGAVETRAEGRLAPQDITICHSGANEADPLTHGGIGRIE